MCTGHKLKGAGLEIIDVLVAAMTLARLTKEYSPMIVGLDSTNANISSDFIKTKLLRKDDKCNRGER